MLQQVEDSSGGTHGRAVIMTGRRRVGKSRLAQEFCDRSGAPYLIFQATRGRNPAAERSDFADTIAHSALPSADHRIDAYPADWNRALRELALAAPQDRPSIVVIDEVPWLMEQDQEFEGALQAVWDRELSAMPILLLLVGSDATVMEGLQQYHRPFFGRAAKMTVRPLSPADVQSMTALEPADAFDAYLLTGGFPEIVRSWAPGTSRTAFLDQSLGNPLSPLLAAAELTLLGEFPDATHARAVLSAVGSGERTFSAIASLVGGTAALPSGTLSPILATLIQRHVLAVDNPLSMRADTKNKRYRIADPYLRFWLAYLDRGLPQIERGRADAVLNRIEQSWPVWRGRAVEPVLRESLNRLLPSTRWPDVEAVGGWWNRQNNPEIDLVGADREPKAERIGFVGSVKWLDSQPFGEREYAELARSLLEVPGAGPTTPTVAISRCGVADGLHLAEHWGPADLLDAWR
jgi:uncharacterized protein